MSDPHRTRSSALHEGEHQTTAGGAAGAELRFDVVPLWGRIPHGITFKGDATSVAIDSADNVYVFNRGSHPLVVLDRDGEFLWAWPEDGTYYRPHAITIDDDDNLFLVDDGGHFIEKRTPDGRLLLTLGSRGQVAEWQSGECFNRPTDLVVHPATGDMYVSDGYGNSRVHQFSHEGRHIRSWGSPGTSAGEFSLPHNLSLLGEELLVVCDRENFRLQLFTLDGEFVDQWHMHRPCAATRYPGSQELLLVGELGPTAIQRDVPGLGNRVVALDQGGNTVAQFGEALPGAGPEQFIAPHGMAADSRGDVYVAEVSGTYCSLVGGAPSSHEGGELPSIRKWRRA